MFFKIPLIIPENLVEVNHQIGRSQWQLLALPAGCPRLCLFQHLSAYTWNNYSVIRIKSIFFISQINELLVTIWGYVRIRRGWKQLSSKLKICEFWTYGLSGYDYRVTKLSISYLTVSKIIMQSFKLIRRSNMFRTDGLINYFYLPLKFSGIYDK